MVFNMPEFNYTSKIETINNLLNISSGGPIIVVKHFLQPLDYYISIIVLLFTVGVTYIKTGSPTAVAYVTLLLSALFATFVPHTTLKIAYIFLVFAMAAMLYAIYKSW